MIIKPLYQAYQDIHSYLYMNQFNKKYENLFIGGWLDESEPNKHTWNSNGFGFYSNDGQCVGFIKWSRNHPSEVINIDLFSIFDSKYSVPIFRLIKANIKQVMAKRVPKLTFSTMVDSDAEKVWDKLIEKYNGRVVGTKTNDVIDMNGNYRDFKLYEILNPNFTQRANNE